jgi:hypothetical protein
MEFQGIVGKNEKSSDYDIKEEVVTIRIPTERAKDGALGDTHR